jgi:hypothetical protein
MTTERVDPASFSLDSTRQPDECLCLVPAHGGWEVFYSERGQRTGTRLFDTEDEACEFLADRLLADEGNRLPAD